MTGDSPTVSIVVVSHGRPGELARCLTGLSQLRYPTFEIVVVACAAGQARVRETALADAIKLAACDEANISVARNIGIRLAAGEIVAFVDDDAVPEPLWLDHLARAFDDGEVVAAGGFTHARNGIEIASRGAAVGPDGREMPIAVDESIPTVLTPRPGRAIKLEGTNMAIRRDVLRALGGFDPAYRFYLDDTDLAMRLVGTGAGRVAVVPLARMHHASAASDRRRSDKVARTLHEVGASLAVLLRRHAPGADPAPRLAEERAARRAALLRHMVAGRVEPRDVGRVLATFDAGVAEGLARDLPDLAPIGDGATEFLPFLPDRPPREPVAVFGHWSARRRLRQAARDAAVGGHVSSIYQFSMTALYHRVSFTADGVWKQRGGLWGRSLRTDPLLRPWRMRDRAAREIERTQDVRGVPRLTAAGRQSVATFGKK